MLFRLSNENTTESNISPWGIFPKAYGRECTSQSQNVLQFPDAPDLSN